MLVEYVGISMQYSRVTTQRDELQCVNTDFSCFLAKKWKHNTNFIRNLLKENATANCVEALSGNGKKCGAVLWEKIMSREVTYFIWVSWKECIWSGYWVFGARQIPSEMCIKTSSNLQPGMMSCQSIFNLDPQFRVAFSPVSFRFFAFCEANISAWVWKIKY